MTEKEYRFQCLKDSGKLSNRRIVLYGVGVNAGYIINHAPEADIIGLMDEKQTGRFFWGKEVLSKYQILEQSPDVIIMAAEHEAVQTIYQRIKAFCTQYRIELLNMYGQNEAALHQMIRPRRYDNQAQFYETAAQEIAKYDAVGIGLEAALCEARCRDMAEYFHAAVKLYFENQQNGLSKEQSFDFSASAFGDYRHLSERRIAGANANYTLDDIYHFMQYLPGMTREIAQQLKELEVMHIIESFAAKPEMLELINEAIRQGKRIYINAAKLILSEQDLPRLMQRLNLNIRHVVLHDRKDGLTFANGLLREEIEKYRDQSFLYIGTGDSDLIVPLLYRQNVLAVPDFSSAPGGMAEAGRPTRRKSVLFISACLPRFDRDAGSRTIFMYLKLFIKYGYAVKFMPTNFWGEEPYTYICEQMGVEVLSGNEYRQDFNNWLIEHQTEIDYAFLNYPLSSLQFLELLLKTNIKLRYFGHDLHFLRLMREYQLTGDILIKERADEYFRIEGELIAKIPVVYYPSEAEIKIVADKFRTNKAKAIKLFFYADLPPHNLYEPDNRKDLLFVGGFAHAPNRDAVLWFVREIYPDIYEKVKLKFIIVGSNMPEEIRQLDHPGIEARGFVPDDELEELYRQVRLVVIPLRYGAGVKGKVLEAIYRGIPIVTTGIGAEGIDDQKEFLCIADEASQFAQSVVNLYGDTDLLRSVSKRYRSVIKQHYQEEAAWDIIKNDFTGGSLEE